MPKLPKIITISLLLALTHGLAWSAELEDGVRELDGRRYSEAMKILLPLANSGNDEAQRIIGEMSFNGQGIKRSPVAAFKWNELSAQNGNKTAQYNLGYLYEHGEGVSQSKTQAIDWYTKAAVQGYVLAQRKLGDLYSASDRNKAIYWYDKARQVGDEISLKQFSKLSTEREHENTVFQAEMAEIRSQRERIAEEKSRQDWEQQQAERLARNREDDSSSVPARVSTPFDGLDSINKAMRDGQRNIAAAQAARARQQQWQQDEERRRASDSRDRQQVGPRRVAQADVDKRQIEASKVAEQQRQDQVLQQEQQRRDQEKAAKLAQQKTDEAAAAKQAQLEELTALKNGIRLRAITCDGKDHYYATGVLPKLKKQPDCIDVSFQASCPDSRASSNGIARNFIGVSGCFGDTYEIEPKPACPANLVKIVVTEVQPGCKLN